MNSRERNSKGDSRSSTHWVLFKFHFTNAGNVGAVGAGGRGKKGRKWPSGRCTLSVGKASREIPGRSSCAPRTAVAGHFSLLCVPFVRVTRGGTCACVTRRGGARVHGTGLALALNIYKSADIFYLEQRENTGFRPRPLEPSRSEHSRAAFFFACATHRRDAGRREATRDDATPLNNFYPSVS